MTQSISKSATYLQDLIKCPSVTPHEGGALSYLEKELTKLGFSVERVVFSDKDTPDIENLYARLGSEAPHICFAGHTDVVPVGNEADWSLPPFSGEIKGGYLYGRGAVDMKGGIACFMGAVERYLKTHVTGNGKLKGSISFLITGDEEGPAINGTSKLLEWATNKGEVWDACIVGEPSNPNAIGDAIKNGRRGSQSGRITVKGIQGHAAYPHLADNPVRSILDMLVGLLGKPFDCGTNMFQPTNLEVTSIDVGNSATNVIPATASAIFNVRFNDEWNEQTLKAEILKRLNEGAKSGLTKNTDEKGVVEFDVDWLGITSPVFLTKDDTLIGSLEEAIVKVTGSKPELSTGGGTSDARFIKDYCPVVEFGLVGQTMHQVDERTELKDLDILTDIYEDFLTKYFS